MTKEREALKLALEALDGLIKKTSGQSIYSFVETERRIAMSACVGIREALAQPEQEPVAWRTKVMLKTGYMWNYTEARVKGADGKDLVDHEPLYTNPPAPAGYAKKIESLIAERDALKAKLAEQPAQQEPDPDELTIAYLNGIDTGKKRKPWVGLTEQEAFDCFSPNPVTHSKKVEAKLKENNCGH